MLVIATEVELKLHVAGLVAPEGELVTEQVRATVPVNVLAGVTVIVEVLPVVDPGVMLILPLLVRVKLLLPLGGSQKFEHPTAKTTTSGAAANNTRPHFLLFIAVPRFTSLSRTGHIVRRPGRGFRATFQGYRLCLESGETLRCTLLKIETQRRTNPLTLARWARRGKLKLI